MRPARLMAPSAAGEPGAVQGAPVPWLAPAIVFVMYAVRVAILPRLGLFNDEAYYWDWSRRLQASYYDHPPAVAYLIAASTRVLGRTLLAIHAPALVLSALTCVVMYRFALDLFPGRRDVAWWAVAMGNASLLFGVGAVFTTPDAPCTLAWITTAWLAWRALHRSPRWWLPAGVVAGLGLLSKYTFVLLPPALLLYAIHPRQRRALRRPEPWIALATMLVLFVPVILWNRDHHWASFLFQAAGRHERAFRPWLTVPRFFAAQQSLTPLVWIACVAGMVRSWRLGRAGDEAHRYLFDCSAVILGFFAVTSLLTFVNPNWFAFGFLTAIVSAADWLATLRSRAARAAPALLAAVVTLLFYVQAVWLVFPIPPRVDFATDLHGWDEVGQRLRQLREAMPHPDRTFVVTRRLQLTGLTAFHAGDDVVVTRMWGRGDQYDWWRDDEALRGHDAIYLADDTHFSGPAVERFHRCERAQDLDVVRRGRHIRTFSFWRCFAYLSP